MGKKLARILPVCQVKSAVAKTSPSGGSRIIFHVISVGRCRRGPNSVVIIKMNPDFERNSPGAGCSMSGLRSCSRVEKNTTDSVLMESSCGPSAGLEGHDVQVVSQTDVGPDGCREGRHSGADGADGVSLGGGHTASADTKGGSSSCGCGGDLRGVAD